MRLILKKNANQNHSKEYDVDLQHRFRVLHFQKLNIQTETSIIQLGLRVHCVQSMRVAERRPRVVATLASHLGSPEFEHSIRSTDILTNMS
jgi:hypothetical protein